MIDFKEKRAGYVNMRRLADSISFIIMASILVVYLVFTKKYHSFTSKMPLDSLKIELEKDTIY